MNQSLHDLRRLIFVADVVVIHSTRETVASNVINQLTNVVAKFNANVKIHKYKRFHEGHHFIMMPMEVQSALRCDMDRFIRDCAYLFHDKRLRCHLSLSFCI
jgi:hypothetical protein